MKNKYYGYFKVASTGYSYVTTIVFNPFTLEVKSGVTYDADDPRNENEELANVRSWDDATKLYNHYKGIIQVGDLVAINRGRKYKGETKRVVKEFTYKIDGTYGHGDIDYLVFEDGTKVAKHNCDLVKNYDELFEKLSGHPRQFYLDKYFSKEDALCQS